MPEWLRLSHALLLLVAVDLFNRCAALSLLNASMRAHREDLERQVREANRPKVTRRASSWEILTCPKGCPQLVLTESLPTTGEDAQILQYVFCLPAPWGANLLESTARNRDVMVEKLLAEGTRVAGLEEALSFNEET